MVRLPRSTRNELRGAPYATQFPTSLDPSPFADTHRFCEPMRASTWPLPDWWGGSQAPLVYVTFGTVLGHTSIAADTFATAIDAVIGIDA